MKNFAKNNPSIICLSETWLIEQIDKNLFVLKEYSPIFYHNGSSRNDGVGIYLQESLKVQQLNVSHDLLNLVVVKFTNVMKESYIVLCISRAPSTDKKFFIKNTSSLLNNLTKYTAPIVMLSIINFDLIKITHLTNVYLV